MIYVLSKETNHLNDIVNYAENYVSCRRQILLAFLGEKFKPENCKNFCDNCNNKGFVYYKNVDMTHALKYINYFLIGDS